MAEVVAVVEEGAMQAGEVEMRGGELSVLLEKKALRFLLWPASVERGDGVGE